MEREKTAGLSATPAEQVGTEKKPYAKPLLRRLGTVGELTQSPNPYGM